jgi:Tfp pilus assembly protein PilX
MALAIEGQCMSRDERGSVLVSTMMFVLIITLIGAGIFYAAVVDNRMMRNDLNQDQTFYTAEAGLNIGLRELADSTSVNNFNHVFTNGGSVALFTNQPFPLDANNNARASYTVTAAAVPNTTPKQMTVTATGCTPAITTGSCPSANTQTTVQAVLIFQDTLAGPFFALGKFTLQGGSGALVDSFDSSQAVCHPPPASNAAQCYTTTKCQAMGCGANVSANGGGDPATSATVTVGNKATIYGNVTDAFGVVSLNAGANIYGNVTYAPSPNGNCTGCWSPTPVHGTYTAQATTHPVPPAVQPCGTFTPLSVVQSNITPMSAYIYSQSTGDFSLGANKTITIAPITGGYCFHTFTINGTANITNTTTPIVISLTGGLSVTSNGSISNTTYKAEQFQVLSSATCTGSCTPSPPTNSIQVAGGTNTYLYIYAPQTQIAVSGGGNLYGAMLGNDLSVTGGAQLHFDKALGNSGKLAGGIPNYTWSSGTWKTCKNPQCT